MSEDVAASDPATWDPALDAVVAAQGNHKVVFENEKLRGLEVLLLPGGEEPVHHHRWPSVFVFDQFAGPIHEFSPEGVQLPPRAEVFRASEGWDGCGSLVVHMPPQPAGRTWNASDKPLYGIRTEMKA